MIDYSEYIEAHTLRCEAGYRGGGIQIDLSELLHKDDCKMTAYQNYLGGGMLGSIGNSYNFDTTTVNQSKLKKITEALNRYYHSLTNHDDDEWTSTSYEDGQSRPLSAY